jgi:CubicO group peptidase (beta-lactamase class C family)
MGGPVLARPVPSGPLSRAERGAIARWLTRARRSEKIPGLAIGLIRDGRAVLSEGAGVRDRERDLPATPRTIFGLASITKSFTALTVLRLAEHGQLRVRDPVVRWLPEYRTPNRAWSRRTTLHHLLTHTSGLPPLPSIYYTASRSFALDLPYDPAVARRVGIDTERRPIDTYEGLLEYLATERYRPLGPPGARFSYSNEAFGLLGAVIERVTGRTYESVLDEEILRPAEMRSTTFDHGIMLRAPEVTVLYSPNRRRPQRGLVGSEIWWEQSCMRAAGALRSNVEDLTRYVELFVRGGRVGRERIVAAASLDRMLRPSFEVQPGQFYGYGVMVQPDWHGTVVVQHSGGLPGVSSNFAALPRKGIAGVVLANREQANATRVLRGALNVLGGWPVDAPYVDAPPVAPARSPLRAYEGWYCSGEGIWAQVRARRDRLRVDFRGIEETERNLTFRPAGADRFVLRSRGAWIPLGFLRDRSGRIEAADLGLRILRRRTAVERRGAARGRMVW